MIVYNSILILQLLKEITMKKSTSEVGINIVSYLAYTFTLYFNQFFKIGQYKKKIISHMEIITLCHSVNFHVRFGKLKYNYE